jgi:hypothetical protein
MVLLSWLELSVEERSQSRPIVAALRIKARLGKVTSCVASDAWLQLRPPAICIATQPLLLSPSISPIHVLYNLRVHERKKPFFS